MTGSGWSKARVALGGRTRVIAALDKALAAEALRIQGRMKEGLVRQAPGGEPLRKLSPLTLAMRKLAGFEGTKILIRSGEMMRAISVKKHGPLRYEVGVLRTARRRSASGKFAGGASLANVARVHEYGKTIVIRVTPKMRAFFFAALAKLNLPPKAGNGMFKRGILILRIPARPFIRPAFEAQRRDPQASRRIMRHAGILLRGEFGSV